jgi:hypothetical protein
LMEWAATTADRRVRKAAAQVAGGLRDTLQTQGARTSGPRRGRPTVHGASHYEAVARAYLAARTAGTTLPVRAVMRAFAAIGPSEPTAYRWIRTAHARGLISNEEMPVPRPRPKPKRPARRKER